MGYTPSIVQRRCEGQRRRIHIGATTKTRCGCLPIDSRFQRNRKKVGKDKGVTIWGPVEPPEKLGIRGSNVAVDCDLCTGCGVCLEICPTQVYEWRETSGHPTSKKKSFPVREVECVQCYKCETRCPEQAIRIVYGPTDRLTYIASYLFFFQAIGGISYGVLFGPSLGLLILFYVGWLTLVVAFFFFFSLIIYFRKRGKPGDGKGLMNTTVLVDSGTYGIIRHPFLLGVMLMMCASILISQHWLTAIVGVPIIVWGYAEAVKEEKGLVVKFGDEYKRYMEKVPRMNLVLGIMRLVRRRLSSKC
jgi:protein-S-isoprenylcysteine O-methyltransferase Ste14/NAD-dependent dihydropyrimidine dehydrogenase PreA subunit